MADYVQARKARRARPQRRGRRLVACELVLRRYEWTTCRSDQCQRRRTAHRSAGQITTRGHAKSAAVTRHVASR
jgi:hypothetical protein